MIWPVWPARADPKNGVGEESGCLLKGGAVYDKGIPYNRT